MLLIKQQQLFPMFCVFYTIHHIISFFITGTWINNGPCCAEDDNNFILRTIVIWLSADIWIYSQNIYWSLWPETNKNVIRKM